MAKRPGGIAANLPTNAQKIDIVDMAILKGKWKRRDYAGSPILRRAPADGPSGTAALNRRLADDTQAGDRVEK
jgi:hypothetical protein